MISTSETPALEGTTNLETGTSHGQLHLHPCHGPRQPHVLEASAEGNRLVARVYDYYTIGLRSNTSP